MRLCQNLDLYVLQEKKPSSLRIMIKEVWIDVYCRHNKKNYAFSIYIP